MNCKSCNTPMGGSGRCPNCGRAGARGVPRAEQVVVEAEDTVVEEIDVEEEIDVDLELETTAEVDALEEVARVEPPLQEQEPPPAPPNSSRRIDRKRKPRSATRAARRPRPGHAPKPGPPAPGGKAGAPPAGVPLRLDASQLRALLEEDAALVEPGLCIYEDDTGMPVGIDYETEVGSIDLLAEDANGDLVVLMIAMEGATQATVTAILERVGWVVRHLIKKGEGVRAIALIDPDSAELGYAAAAVTGTISFKTCHLSLRVEDLGG